MKLNVKPKSARSLISSSVPEVLLSLQASPLPERFELLLPPLIFRVCFQLVEAERDCALLPPPPRIEPPTRDVFLEVVLIGLRDLLPFQYLPIQKPMVCCCVQDCRAGLFVASVTAVAARAGDLFFEISLHLRGHVRQVHPT